MKLTPVVWRVRHYGKLVCVRALCHELFTNGLTRFDTAAVAAAAEDAVPTLSQCRNTENYRCRSMQRCTRRKALTSPLSAILKYLLEKQLYRKYNSCCCTVIERAKTTFAIRRLS